jgi:hypothetical protein
MSLRNYILRIYRYENKRPDKLVGIVEEVGAEGKKAFTNMDELWEIVSHTVKRPINSGRGAVREKIERSGERKRES